MSLLDNAGLQLLTALAVVLRTSLLGLAGDRRVETWHIGDTESINRETSEKERRKRQSDIKLNERAHECLEKKKILRAGWSMGYLCIVNFFI